MPQLVVVAGFLVIAAGAATVTPPSTPLAMRDYPEFAGTASSVLGVLGFGVGAIAAPLVGLGGERDVGELTLHYDGFDVVGEPGVRLTTFSAEPGSPTHDALQLLERSAELSALTN